MPSIQPGDLIYVEPSDDSFVTADHHIIREYGPLWVAAIVRPSGAVWATPISRPLVSSDVRPRVDTISRRPGDTVLATHVAPHRRHPGELWAVSTPLQYWSPDEIRKGENQ